MTTKLEKSPENLNYLAMIVKLGNPHDLAGLDNLHGFSVVGLQALTEKTHQAGELMVAFTAETQLSEEFAGENNLFRHADKNADPGQAGYLEDNRRVRAIRLRKHASHAIILPLSSLAYTGVNLEDLKPGDEFDTVNGHEICRKYVRPGSNKTRQQKAVAKAFRRVDDKLFPLHLGTAQYARAFETLRPGAGELVLTQKLHGTSIRIGNVPVRRKKGLLERMVARFTATPDWEYSPVYGSRRVTKDANEPGQQHFYESDIWTLYGKKLDGLIPRNVVVYGELIGWTPDKTPIQKGYTYDLPEGRAELYVYRVAVVNENGFMTDLSWSGVRTFCDERGLKHVPELFRLPATILETRDALDAIVAGLLDIAYIDQWNEGTRFRDKPVALSTKKTVDEGVCIRQDDLVPTILKAKSPIFFEHETRMADRDEADMEEAA